MGLLDKLNSGPTQNNQSLVGVTPSTRAAALPTSQMHAQGNFGEEAIGFGRIDKGFIASSKQEAINVKYKQTGEYSKLDLNGREPARREGALSTSQLHAQGNNPTVVQAEASVYDLNGQTPSKYLDNPPV